MSGTVLPTMPHIETAPPPSAPILTIDTSPRTSGPPLACAGVGLDDATLHGDATDPRVTWIDMKDHGSRSALFPKGFTARFEPDLEIFDASGHLRYREGSVLTAACVWGDHLLIGYP
jgi:hypothetical protein